MKSKNYSFLDVAIRALLLVSAALDLRSGSRARASVRGMEHVFHIFFVLARAPEPITDNARGGLTRSLQGTVCVVLSQAGRVRGNCLRDRVSTWSIDIPSRSSGASHGLRIDLPIIQLLLYFSVG